MPNFTTYKLLEACHKPGCPVCRLEQDSIERYLESQFDENVNTPEWRDWLRGSLGFCHEHAWLAVDQRLGDALGFAIIYRDVVHSALQRLDNGMPLPAARHWTSLLERIPEQARNMVKRMLHAFTPQKRCPVCQYRDEMTRVTLAGLVQGLETPEMVNALQVSEGLCLPHLRQALEHIKDVPACEKLQTIHREKLETLESELAEFIRKNDYRFKAEGFGREGNAWLRTVRLIAGSRREKG